MNLTMEQITALAPDAASVKAGRGLVNSAKWPTLGQSANALWGECQGSGSKPYQVSVDLGGPAFKCTCPSRKFPCKHGLGLLWLAVEKPATVQIGDPPPWVADWLAVRHGKVEKQAAVAAGKKDAPADAEAAAKRAAKRLNQMGEGGAELARWLSDQVRQGLATYPQQSATYFAGVAARLVDAKIPGLVNEMVRLESFIHSGDGWPQRVLGQLGRMSLITEGLSRFSTLPESLQGDLRAVLGWAMDKEEVLANPQRVTDDWCVLGQVFTERDRLWERRTWLLGRTQAQPALLLDFMHGQRSFPVPLVVGTSVQAELAFYPSAYPLRALLVNPPESARPLREPVPALRDFDAALAARAAALAVNPWLLAYPFAVENVIPLRRHGAWRLRDVQGAELPLNMADRDAWELLAISGGHPVAIFGEWSDNEFRALGVWADGFHGLGSAES
ncbi:MAG TPA: SWIM zinc finger family protein [Candidatus Competibacteraceae bacterium]|nr:SWIM zinc finger family protein [Candidatus Competibacteraceae bacterium]HSA46014.1 SWIM zinc finger family protein [Candidatus Competibacteraceae bacterium]